MTKFLMAIFMVMVFVCGAMANPCTEIKLISEEELMADYVVEQEARGLSKEHKCIIACVIRNRLESSSFRGRTVREILTAKGQFPSISNYYSKKNKPTDDTVEVVRAVFSGKVNVYECSKGAVFFYNPRKTRKLKFFESRPFLFELEGHRFFK